MIILQVLSNPQPVFRFLVPAFLVFALVVFFYNRWYLKSVQKYNLWVVVRQLLLLAGAFGLFLVIPSPSLRGLYLILAVFVIVFFQYALENFAENLWINQTLIIAFSYFTSLFAFGQYYPSYRFFSLVGVFASTFLISRAFYEFIPQPDKAKVVISAVLGLLVTELFWALNFLPFHFSALAMVLFGLYYFSLIVNYYFFFQILNFKKIQFHLALVFLCITAAILATPWEILQ